MKDDLIKAGSTHMTSSKNVIGHGPDMGLEFPPIDTVTKGGIWVSHRAAFLEQILKSVDPGNMHAGKKLQKIEQNEEITLFVEDGTTHVCDVALGADGIHRKTRKYVVGNDEAAESIFAGWRGTWNLASMDKALEKLGPELLDTENPYQYGWIGPGTFVMHDMCSNNTLVQCVITKRVDPSTVVDPKESVTMVSADEVKAAVKDWDSLLAVEMVELSVKPDGELTPMISLRHHKPIPSFGSGGAMAMEDAYLLSELFANVKFVKDAKAALLAYDAINRPRRHRLIESSCETGLLLSGCHPEAGMDKTLLQPRLIGRWNWILDVDLAKQRDDALSIMRDGIVA